MALSREQSIRTGLPAQPITSNQELFSELVRLYNAVRILVQSIDQHTGEPINLECGENIAYGQTVGVKSDGKLWLADDGVLACHGFCNTPGGGVTGEFVSMQIFGMYPPFAAGSLTPGLRYYQSSTPGAIGVAATAPSSAQVIGFAMSDTQLYFMPNLKY